jgi:pimeloyl-ACP methyl ester carboxylesterase
MHSAVLHFKTSVIHYRYCLNGKKLLWCFHGYGESAQSFEFLEEYLSSYSLFALDLPFPGKTEWRETKAFTPNDLLEIMNLIRLKHDHSIENQMLLGFSMGGRVALHILQLIPSSVERLILLAPDGLKVNFWYWLSTQTSLGNRLFHYTMKHPNWFYGLLRLYNKSGMLNQSFYKFIRYYIHDKKIRKELYDRWTCMRRFKPDLPKVKKQIVEYKIPVRLVYGKYDRIIRFERGEKFCNGIDSWCHLQVIDSGHQLMNAKNAQQIAHLLQS